MKIPTRSWISGLLLLSLAGVVLYAGTVDAGTESAGVVTNVPALFADTVYEDFQMLAEAISLVRKYHVEEKSYRDIIFSAVHGVMRSLDPHSSFLEPDDYEHMQDDTQGRYGGIGIHIGMRDDVLTVIAPIEGTPGFRAGLGPGDRIVGIDGDSTVGIDMKTALNRLRGEAGSPVTITISREGVDQPFDVKIVREEIKVASVRGVDMLEDGVGYIRITQFTAPTAEMLAEALDDLASRGLSALVLDLRSNPGGLLRSAVQVAEMFLARGRLIVTTEDRSAGKVDTRALGVSPLLDIPMVVLINGGSASASEIVAGALQDHKRAVLVGERSFGKGSVQSIVRLSTFQDAALRLTTALYFTPSGAGIHEKGIEPDIPVYLSPGEWREVAAYRAENERGVVEDAAVTDRQLQRALDLLKAIRLFQSR